jgi:mRNA interferase MazF
MTKDFSQWNALKTKLQENSHPMFEERQVWWTSIGINVGDEEDGKNALFNRPVVILKKFNQHLFVGLPITTQLKTNPYYLEIEFLGRKQAVMLSHIRTLDAKRLSNRMGKLSQHDFEQVRLAMKNLL